MYRDAVECLGILQNALIKPVTLLMTKDLMVNSLEEGAILEQERVSILFRQKYCIMNTNRFYYKSH